MINTTGGGLTSTGPGTSAGTADWRRGKGIRGKDTLKKFKEDENYDYKS